MAVHDTTIEDRVQELTWALVDDHMEPGDMQLLENLLLSDDNARRTYIHCMQLHADLYEHFAKPAEAGAGRQSPVLSFLGDAAPLDSQPKVS